MQAFIIINNVGMLINVGAKCKELIDKGVCNKGFIWNPSNCECECDKSCDAGEYLYYKNCKCRKILANKLVEECTKTVEEVKIASKNEHKNECSSCILYIVFNILCNQYWNWRLFCLL